MYLHHYELIRGHVADLEFLTIITKTFQNPVLKQFLAKLLWLQKKASLLLMRV